MKRFFDILLSLVLMLTLPACDAHADASSVSFDIVFAASAEEEAKDSEKSTQSTAAEENKSNGGEGAVQSQIPREEGGSGRISITLMIGNDSFSAKLYDNATGRALTKRFPLTLVMGDLHGNEKYNYLSEGLPTNSKQPRSISAGDIMLFGSDCLVLFYESFESGFGYTELGRVDDAEGFALAVGSGETTVSFALT